MNGWLIAALIIGAICIAALIVLAFVGKRTPKPIQHIPEPPQEAPQPVDFDNPAELTIGDFIDVAGVSFRVMGKVVFIEDGYTWYEFYLRATDLDVPFMDEPELTELWVSVETKPVLKFMRWIALIDSELDELVPGAKTLVYDGKIFTRSEKGTADYTVSGATDLPNEGGVVRYIDYTGPNGAMLSCERFDSGNWDVSIGEPLQRGLFRIYPMRGSRD